MPFHRFKKDAIKETKPQNGVLDLVPSFFSGGNATGGVEWASGAVSFAFSPQIQVLVVTTVAGKHTSFHYKFSMANVSPAFPKTLGPAGTPRER